MTFKIMLPILGNIIFIENCVVFMLHWEVSHQNISRFTANICFYTLTIRWVEPNYVSPSILLFWLAGIFMF